MENNYFNQLIQTSNYTFFPIVYSACGRKIILENNKELVNFGSCDYLGLANDERLKFAAKKAIDKFGTNISGAMIMSGYTYLHYTFEKKLEEMFKGYHALMFTTSFLGNLGTIPFLVGPGDVIMLDKLSHSCLINGALLSKADIRLYSHNDMNELEELLIKYKEKRKLVITDGVFSADGDVADITSIVNLCKKYNAISYVDDAHGVGLLGDNGCGIVEVLSMLGKVDIISGTMSKSFGSTGGFILLKNQKVYQEMKHLCHMYTASRAVSPGVVAASLEAIKINDIEGNMRRQRVMYLADTMNKLLKGEGFDTLNTATTIIPVVFGDAIKTGKITKKMMDSGFLVSHFPPPYVEKNKARLRIGVTYNHTENDIKDFVKMLSKVVKEC